MIESDFEALGHLAEMVTDKISSSELTIETYISTENMVPNKGGVQRASKLPTTAKVNAFMPGDVLFSNIRTYFKKVWLANCHGGASADVIIFRPLDKQKIDNHYLFYVLSNDPFIASTVTASKGTKMPRGDKHAMSHYKVRLPTTLIQKRIATILSAYDDLIEKNLRRIKILEEMAQNLYREWFVKFRFPGHEHARMVDSPLGKIPEGWEVRRLSEVCNLVMGQSPKSEFYNDVGKGLPFHQGVTDFRDRFPITRLYCAVQNRLAEAGDILFSVRAPVGRINISPTQMIIGRGLSAIQHSAGYQWFAFHLLKEKFKEEDLIGGGTIFKAVTKADMQSIELLSADDETHRRFEEIASPIEIQIKNMTKKNETLRQTRDLLLPKLISGELDVSKLDIDIRGAT